MRCTFESTIKDEGVDLIIQFTGRNGLPYNCWSMFNVSGSDRVIFPGNRHHYSKPRRPDRYSCRSDAGKQNRLRKPADPRPLRPSGKKKTNKPRSHLQLEETLERKYF